MPKYEVLVTRITTEYASFEVSAIDAEEAELLVRAKLEPDLPLDLSPDEGTKREKAAKRYFLNHASDNGEDTVEFEYDTNEFA